jgi:corrinoid protein of di/trimethylamine methyltransferase
MSEHSALYEAIIAGNADAAVSAVKENLDAGVEPQKLLGDEMIPAMDEVGRRFECNEFFVPELLIAARAMKACMEWINPALAESGVEKKGRVVIGTVQGDLHDIGKNLVASMLEGGGFEVIDLGVDVSAEKFVEAAKEKEGTIIALSALLTTTMPQMKIVIESLESAGVRKNAKIMVGGAPITDDFAKEIGADGYSENASSAVALARQLAA